MTASVPKISVSVVVPVYNSEGSLPVLISALEPVLSSNCSAYEVILVDDGSRDSSATVIDSLSRQYINCPSAVAPSCCAICLGH